MASPVPSRRDGWSATIARRCLELGPARISYQVAGAGPPVVLIHGLSGSGRWWARNVEALAAHFQVHVIDLIGFGASRGRQRFVLEEASGYLAAWMERLGLEQASVVGHSMGGFIAADLAADFPERLDRLVLVDAVAMPFDLRQLRRPGGIVRAARRLPFSFYPVLVADALRAGPLTIARAARELLQTDLRPKLAHIAAPTLVIWGEHDAIVPPEIGRQIEGALPDARLEIIKGAGHNPMWDRPREFNRLVAEFIGSDLHRSDRC